MRTKRNWLRTTIAMLTLVATVLETGFSSVETLAAEITTEDGIVVNNDAVEEVPEENLDITVEPDNGGDADLEVLEASEDDAFEETLDENPDVEEYSEEVPEEAEVFEEAEELLEGTLDVSDGGITGSGYDEISVYVNTDELDNKDKFRIEFTGPASASYNPVLNEDLDKTNDGRYDFDSLEGGEFTIRANSSDDVILSYSYNEDGYPLITVRSEEAEKVLTTKILTAEDDSRISAVSGEGYDSVTVEFATDKLSDKTRFKLVVESVADATVDGNDAKAGITGLSKDTGSLVIDNLDGESFVAYVLSDSETKLETVAEVVSTEDGRASIEINDVATKRVYEYEDAKIYVRATLEKADAVPDDAYFGVTPLTEEEAGKYLEALNAKLEEGQTEITANDILLYDISFYTDESKSEEIEPEEGSVSVSIEFKQSQVSEELGVEHEDEINITHFEENGSDVEPVAVEMKPNNDTDSVEFSVDSFSVYGIWANSMASVKPGNAVSYADVLGEAVNYGVVANEMHLDGHMETNFAVGTMHGSAQIQSCKNNGGGAGRVYIGAYDDTSKTFLMDKNGNAGMLQIITTEDVLNKMDPAMKNRTGVTIDTHSMSETQIKSKVSSMVNVVRDISDSLMQEENCYQYKSLWKNQWDKTVDLTTKGAGTYYISFDASENDDNKFPGSNYEIRINSNQNVVLNIPDTNVSFGQYRLYIDGKQYTPQGNSDEEILFEKLIFNCPNATTAQTNGPVTGTFLLPRAKFSNNSVAAGFLVANNILKIGGQEWHCISKNIEIVDDDETTLDIEVTKLLKDGDGNIVDGGLWPEEGFTFNISKYPCNDPGDKNDANVEHDIRYIPDLKNGSNSVTIYRNTPGQKASFGTLSFKGQEVFNNSRAHVSGSYPNTKYLSFMYKVTEVKGNATGITYDTEPFYIKIFVNSQKVTDGSVTKYYVWTETKVNRTVKEYNCWPGMPEFVNKYIPVETPVAFEGSKSVNGSFDTKDVPDGKFRFTLQPFNKTTNSWDPVIETVSNDGTRIAFSEVLLRPEDSDYEVGNTQYFYYKIKEVDDCSPYTADKKVYIAVAKVEKGKTSASVNYYEIDNDASANAGHPYSNKIITGKQALPSFSFNNTYEAEGSTTIYGIKTLENRDLKAGEFTFTISSPDDPKFETRVANKSVTNDADGNFNFGEMKYTLEDAGKTYKYTVAETKGADSTITYAENKYTVEVTVTDNGNGTLSVSNNKGAQNNPLKFVNVYSAKGEVVFQATKQYASGSNLSKDKEFSFILSGDKIKPQKKTVKGEGTVTFDTIDYADINAKGTYNYTINEVIPDGAVALAGDASKKVLDGVIYDARTYNIKVVVSDDGSGVLKKTITADYDNSNPTKAVESVNPVFINDYRVDSTDTDINGTKVLHGKDLKEGEFTFNLAAYDAGTKAAVEAGSVVMPAATSVTNSKGGAFSFDKITFSKAGTYKFLVSEEKGDNEKIDYSLDKYVVTITVSDNGSGKLVVASKVVSKEGAADPVSEIIFNNTYNGEGAVTFYAHKELTGRKIEAGQFTFVVKNSDGDTIDTKSNDASGDVVFEPVKYDNKVVGLKTPGERKVYTYTISEAIPNEGVPKGYTYDTHSETVNVTVTLQADGTLEAVADNATYEKKAAFNNEYHATGKYAPEGNKTLTGRKFTTEDNGKFTAVLYNEAGDRLQTADIVKTGLLNGYDAEFKFNDIEFNETQIGTHKYTIKEEGVVAGVKNDKTVYELTLSVTDNGDGTLNVAPEYSNGAVVFVNDFTADGEEVLHAKKILTGGTLEKDQFTFELRDASGTVIDTKKNDAAGNVTFKKLVYSQADIDKEFTYTISEKNEGKAGFTYDGTEYRAVVRVSLKADGTLDVSKKYYDAKGTEVEEAAVTFENTYAAKGTVELKANKKLIGRDAGAGQFTFSLYDENGDLVGKASNAAAAAGSAGEAVFQTITYEESELNATASHQIEDGKYAKYYTIKEDIPEGATRLADGRYFFNGYTYDTSVYNVVVTLEDKGNGTIDTDWYAYKSGTQPEKPTIWQNIVTFFTGKGANQEVAFTNEYAAEGALDLSAKKVLRGKELKAGDFEFTLSGRDEAGKEFVDPKNNNEDGSVVFDRIRYTKPGEYTYTIKESVPTGATEENGVYVLNGVKYDATEYTVNVVVSDPGTGKLKVDATVSGGGATTSAEVTEGDKTISLCAPAAVTFNNNYDAKPITINPGGTKTLTGRKLEDGEFSFNMKAAAGNTKAYDETVQNVGGTFTFPAIEYTFADMALADGKYADEKTFEYVVTEVIPADDDKLEGVEYDASEYKVVVTVTNSNGTLSAKITSNELEVAANKIASFTNNYNANDSTTFNVKKVVNGTSATNKKFKFTLTGDGISTPLEATAANGETASFAPISYMLTDIKNPDGTYSKTYNYTVSEVNTNEKGYTYSTEVYKAVVTVTSDGVSGKLNIDKELTKDGKPYTEPVMVFTNTYEAKGKVVIDGTKDLVGRELEDGAFTFILSQKEESGEYTQIADTVNTNGKFSFEQNYTQDDIGKTYYYKVNELVPDNSEETGIDYDRSVYDITVTVADNGDGTLNVSKDIKKGEGAAEVCAFTNKDVKPDTVVFEAKKTLTGKALGNDMFTFTLTGDGQNQTVKNKGEDVTFEPIQYSLKDAGKTFNYTIREVVGDTKVDGIKYDESVYNAQVKVTLVDGKLVIDKTVTKDGKVVTDIGFTNSYESKTSVEFGGSKILSGFVDGATPLGTYSFELKDADGNVLQTKEVTPKKAGDSTEIKFDPIEYDQDDYLDSAATDHKFTYTVKEVIPTVKAANVTYDEKEYNITVELAYDINGLLTATKSTSQGVDPATGLVFTNKYEAEGDITLDGIKTITGKDLEDGAYTFTLTGEGQNQSKENKGNTFTFDPIHYEVKDIGEHVYTIAESATTKDGSKYDATKYTVKVNVAEGNDGKLEVTKRVFKTDAEGKETEIGETEPITFNNTFTAKGSIDIDGTKIMKNKPLKAGDFTFILKDENGVVLQTTSHGASALDRKDLTAKASFAFDTIEYTQEDLKAADGSYLSEVKKYYTVEEEAATKAGVTYSTAVYVIEVTIKSDKTENLVVTKKVRNKSEIKSEDGGIRGFFARLIGNNNDENAEIVFENEYEATCVVDPPVLTKKVLGRDIERGKYWFNVDSQDGLLSMGELEKGYHRHVANGYGVSGALMHDPGEIAVDDLKFYYTDLLAFDDAIVDLETGRVEKTFEYTAIEDPKSVVPRVSNTPAVFTLTFTLYDIGDGVLHMIPEKIEDLKWVQQTRNALTDDEYNDVFLNIFNQEGSIDLVGVKKLDGRKLTQNDKFEFVLTDDATGKTVTVNNTNDKFGVPSVVAFNASEIDFLNYRWGVFADEKNELRKYDDRGDHTYTVEETFYGINGIVSDTSKFKITVNVTEAVDANGEPLLDATGKHGRLDVAVTKVEKIISENNKESFDHADGNFFEFKNEFKATGKTELDGIKYLKDQAGNALASPDSMLDQYEFALYSYEDAARTIGKTLVSVAKTSANGSFKLDIPEYTQEVLKDEKGEYADEKTLYYRLVEVKPSSGVWTENNTIFESDGVVYDNTEYDVDVNVKFNGTEKLDVSKTIRKADTGEAITSISYTNIVKEYTTVEGNKYWVDNIKDPSQRPDVTVNLYRRTASGVETKINSYTIVAPDTTYRFATDDKGNKLPTYDSAGRPISYVVEELPITGYLSEKVNYDFYNTAGDILIRKIDADTRAPLSGAVLAIFDGSTEIERWTSGTSAHVIESALTAGKTYTLREITAPEGYGVAEDMTFTVPADGSSITVTMSDPPIIGSVRLTKRDASTRETLAGAEFALYNDAGTRIYATGSAGSYRATTSTSNGVFVTDSAGTLTIADLPYGTYYFVETKAPEGYTLSTERLGFTILRSGELVEVTYLNTKATGSVRLRKVGSDGTRSLAGAVFELYAATPRSIGQAASSTIFSDAYFRYGTYRTNSAGELYVGDLPWDDYYFIEVEAPDGYETATDVNGDDLVYTFTISAASTDRTIDLGGIVNTPERPPITPPPGPTPTPTPGVLGARVKRGGVVNGVLGVRAKPSSGVLGVRVGPVTGDASNIILWLLLLTACVATIVATIVTGRKKKTATK